MYTDLLKQTYCCPHRAATLFSGTGCAGRGALGVRPLARPAPVVGTGRVCSPLRAKPSEPDLSFQICRTWSFPVCRNINRLLITNKEFHSIFYQGNMNWVTEANIPETNMKKKVLGPTPAH